MAVAGLPIVTVLTGGLAVTEAGARGAPVVEAANGKGIPVRFIPSGGIPVRKIGP
jgi:hypothetical protein